MSLSEHLEKEVRKKAMMMQNDHEEGGDVRQIATEETVNHSRLGRFFILFLCPPCIILSYPSPRFAFFFPVFSLFL